MSVNAVSCGKSAWAKLPERGKPGSCEQEWQQLAGAANLQIGRQQAAAIPAAAEAQTLHTVADAWPSDVPTVGAGR